MSKKVGIKTKNGKAKGLYAKENIKKEEFILNFSGKTYYASEASLLPKRIVDHCLQVEENKFIHVFGDAKHINHSCNPNCGFDGNTLLVSMKNIRKGEELSFDYEMSEDSDWVMKCLCGSKKCRKIIGSFKNLPNKLRKKYKNYLSQWIKEKYNIR